MEFGGQRSLGVRNMRPEGHFRCKMLVSGLGEEQDAKFEIPSRTKNAS